MTNIFEVNTEFVDLDNRRNRPVNTITAESLHNRYEVQVPNWLIQGKSILDLGCCLGALGHFSLHNGANFYTGVEIQDNYVTTSKTIFEKYWKPEQYEIIQSDIEAFLDSNIAQGKKWDIVVASGVLYAFLDVFCILEKISEVSSNIVIIDTMFVGDLSKDSGSVIVRRTMPINFQEGNNSFFGIGSSISLNALDVVMSTNGYERREAPLMPRRILQGHDGYHDVVQYPNGRKGPSRYMTRYYKCAAKEKTLQEKIIAKDRTAVSDFQNRPIISRGIDTDWKFDESVAKRFQEEARGHIPDYERVIDMSLDIARINFKDDDNIIDVGSALGFTVDKFITSGFKNVYGVESSDAMIAGSKHKDRIIHSNKFPEGQFHMVLINWTLHFMLDKISYLQSVHDSMAPNGILILSDKTTQSEYIKHLYYQFKIDNGVDPEYIKQKELQLKGNMHTMHPEWYFDALKEIGFTGIEVINSRFGFMTLMCRKF